MSMTDKLWDTLTTVIRMNDNIERLAETVKQQQTRIEDLTARTIRLETALEIALARGLKPSATRLEGPESS